ncbi:hypothetical protein [Catellatospora paridis]|uniref:hypothetical protein n=1 Tax=Catellatospora paridis TaxID=1617086 RepID=UPI0012D39E23|nr:hypothetical protein [Catellatospora paridis]
MPTAVAAAFAAWAAGIMLAHWGLGATPLRLFIGYADIEPPLVGALEPAGIAIAAAFTLLVAGLRSLPWWLNGWAISAGGLPLVLVGSCVELADTPGNDIVSPALASVGLGIMLAGLLLAAVQAPVAVRTAIVSGFVVGLVLCPYILTVVMPPSDLPRVFIPEHFFPGTALALAAVAAATAMIRPGAVGPAADEPRTEPAGSWASVAPIGSAVVVLYAGNLVLRTGIEQPPPGVDLGFWDRPAVPDAVRYGMVVLAAAITLVLSRQAYRRGHAEPARWTVLCLALAAPLHTVTTNSLYLTAGLAWLFAAGAAAAGLGALAAIRAAGRLPWDALGAGTVAAGILVHAVGPRQGDLWTAAGSLLIVVGLCFALSAGLIRVSSAADGAPADVAGCALLGLATVLLAGQALGPLAVEVAESAGFDGTVLTVASVAGAAAALLVALSGTSHEVERASAR